jgi:hypothetical protein
MTRTVSGVLAGVVVAVSLLTGPSPAAAQQSKSAALVGEIAKLLDARKLDSIAAQVTAPNDWAGALYFPGSQLLVVTAKYAAPARLEALLGQKNYRDIYLDLNGAAMPQTRIFISDLGANGLQFDRDRNQPFDTVELADGRAFSFDGDWGRAKISREEYTKAYQAADDLYVQVLQALLAEIKKSS